MKIKENNFDLKARIEKYNFDCANLMYDLASDLLDQVADEDVLLLYEDNNEIFSKLSSLSKAEIFENKDLLYASINVMIDYLKNKPLTEKDMEKMTFDEIIEYVGKLIEDKEISLYDIIKYLQDK